MDMKNTDQIIKRILEINNLIITHKQKGNKVRVIFYQSLLSWVISKQLQNYGYSN
jgi:hypothetical protein